MKISIIIPTYNRADTLQDTLTSIISQTDNTDFEVLIIDNGSTDKTRVVCENFTNKSGEIFKYYYDPEPGLLTGRHLGASLAKGEILCFIDDDVKLASSWNCAIKDAFSDNEVQLATGPCLPIYSTASPFWLGYFFEKVKGKGYSCSWLSLIDLGDKKRSINPNYVWGLNFCIRKDTFLMLGGFHPDNIPPEFQMFQGDGETGLTVKAAQRHYKALYHPQIKIYHYIPEERLTIDYFKKRAFYQGVCNSFTWLRRKYVEGTTGNNFSLVRTVKELLQPIKKIILFISYLQAPKDVRIMINELNQEEKKGFDFHQVAFKSNPKVKEWVLKKDYFDYKLPVLNR